MDRGNQALSDRNRQVFEALELPQPERGNEGCEPSREDAQPRQNYNKES